MSIIDLAVRWGIDRSAVYAHLDRRGVERRGNRKLSAQQVEQAAQLRKAGGTYVDIADMFGVSDVTVRKALKRR